LVFVVVLAAGFDAGAADGVLAGVVLLEDELSLDEALDSDLAGEASAFSDAAFFPPSDFGAEPCSPFG
jgi:hypothetical protein